MSNPIRDEKMVKLVRQFITEARYHLAEANSEAELELLVDRFLGTVAAAGGVALSLRRRHDAMAATLFAVAVRLWTRAPGKPEAEA